MNNEQTLTRLDSLLKEMMMQENTITQILAYIEQHFDQISKFAEEAYVGEDYDYPILRHSPFIRLHIICFRLLSFQDNFIGKNIPNKIMIDTFKDVSLRLDLYQNKHHKIGLEKADALWFRHLEHFNIFKINQIQFQLFQMVYLDSEEFDQDYFIFPRATKIALPSGTPVINVHIQKGAHLSNEGIVASFKEAKEFFETYFPEHQPKAFLCYSWLLHPKNHFFLAKDSHILAFAQQFTLISSNYDAHDAILNLYGKRYPKKCDYPQRTSLQRNALKHFKLLGEGCGIREWEK